MKVNQLKAGVVLGYAGMAVTNIVSLIYTPVMLRFLGKSEYGLYQMVYSVVSYLGLLNFGFNNAYLKFYSGYRKDNAQEEIRKLNGMFLTTFTALAFIAFLCGAFLSFHCGILFSDQGDASLTGTASVLCMLMTVNLALVFPTGLFEAYASAHEQYIFQKVLNITQSVLNPLLTLPLLMAGYRSVSLIIVQTFLTVCKLAVNVWFCVKRLDMRFGFRRMQICVMKEITVFSSYIFINMLVDQINWSVDKLVIGKIRGTAAVAVYALASQLNRYYMNLSTAVSSVFLPRVNRIAARQGKDMNRELTDLFCAVGRIQFLILFYILGGFVILGRYFISLWAGEGYEEVYVITLLLICPVVIPLIQNLGIEIQRAQNKHKFRSVAYLLIAAVNLLISIPLTSAFGAKGAAAGTCASLLIGNGLIMNLYNHICVKLDMIRFWSQILHLLLPGLAALCAGAVFGKYINVQSPEEFILAGALYTLLYAGLEWRFGMNDKEKRLVTGPLEKVKKRLRILCSGAVRER